MLRETIAVWEHKVKAKDGVHIPVGVDNCPLCTKYHKHQCKGCPIQAHTGLLYCQGTPYHDFRDALDGQLMTPEARVHAQRELNFLKRLRINAIETLALRLYPNGDYRDMIYDEITENPNRTDEEIAQDVAQRNAFP